jgi:hypothetical protein
MDENKKSEAEPMLTVESYRNDEHIVKKVPYSSLSIEQLVNLTLEGSKAANEELQRLIGVDILKDGGE